MKEIFKDSFADQYKKLYYKQLINNCPSARIEKQHLYMDPKKTYIGLDLLILDL